MKFRNQYLKYMNPAGDDGAAGGGGGEGNNDDKGEGEDGKGKPSDREAQLLKESMSRKEKIGQLEARLAEYEGVDPKAFREMQERLQVLDQKERELANAKLIEQGRFDEALNSMRSEHEGVLSQVRTQSAAELQAALQERDQLKTQLGAFQAQIEDLTVGAAFGNSAFIREELVQAMNPERSRRLYGDHFDIVEGKVVGYDKPRGQEGRAPLVDKDGQPVSFDEAFKRVLSSQSDYETLIRSSVKPGAGSGTRDDKATDPAKKIGTGVNRIAAALNKGQ
ncbi:DUF6651 domain-containing protein [Aeromonas caviae]|uniref:DUF6651 domain-containing protein n=1 Tax=Aeromonas caviae TaxID=648 RepID=UPI00244CCACD|nr:DUF6651 domain-containing protein [Aeromonas caviae]MDH1221162.1 hypothetical protein [Aeromonas caviae]